MKTLKEIELKRKVKRLEKSSKVKDRIIHNLESLVEVLEDRNNTLKDSINFYKTLIK